MKNLRITKDTVYQYLLITLGSLVFALGQLYFIKPLHIPMGGVSGIALVTNYLWNLPIGVVSIVLNIPLFFLGWRTLGRGFFMKTAFGTVVSSIFVDLLVNIVPAFDGDMLIAALYGGIVMGAGYGLIFRAGGTSGGVDIIAKLITAKFPQFSIGTLILFLDAGVVIASAIVYKNIENALFAVVSIFVQTKIIDTIIYGANKGRVILIKSEYCDEIMEKMYEYLGRLPTFIDNSVEKRNVILCAAHRYEAVKLHNIVKEIDNSAFIVSLEAGEMFGEGFAKLNESA